MATIAYVYADWAMPDGSGASETQLVGELSSALVRNQETFRFSYDTAWLNGPQRLAIDPELQLASGDFHRARNFRAFLDSCPDRWGRLLMRRRETLLARTEDRQARKLLEIDYLLGVHDELRLGGLRFKRERAGQFVDNSTAMAAPPMASLEELERVARRVEMEDTDSPDYLRWLQMLIAPGSSLGGARPKACVVDEYGDLWIAKFPSGHDDYDVGRWEYVVHVLAKAAGVEMTECRVQRFSNGHHTFLTRRFDRCGAGRLHFASALTHLQRDDGDEDASYLELAEFLVRSGSRTKEDLEQLWRRIVFSIAVSNTDDHLRNHGFILDRQGWRLSPAYDINPVTPATGLHLNISDVDNALDFDLALEVIEFFRLKRSRAEDVLADVRSAVSRWRDVAQSLGIARAQQDRLAPAFRY